MKRFIKRRLAHLLRYLDYGAGKSQIVGSILSDLGRLLQQQELLSRNFDSLAKQLGSREQANEAREQANEAREQANEAREQANKAREQANEALEQANEARDQSNRAREKINESREHFTEVLEQANEARQIARDLDHIGQKCRCASGGNLAREQREGLAHHYFNAKELVIRHRLVSRDYRSSPFADDDWTVDYTKSKGIYVQGNEVDVPDNEARVPSTDLLYDPDCAVILVLGQSNAGNHGEGLHRPAREVFVLNFLTMRCHRANDPLPGASGSGGSVWSRLGDRLIERGVFKRVLFIPLAFGGTFITDWIPGGKMHARVALALSRLQTMHGAGILPITAAVWQQGEAEANHTRMSSEAYRLHLLDIISDLRSRNVFAPIFIAQCSLCDTGERPFLNHDSIRSGQRATVNPQFGVFAGPDTDLVTSEFRSDGCHFSAAGLDRCADAWLQIFASVRDLLLKP